MPIHLTHIITYHAVRSLIAGACVLFIFCCLLYNWKKWYYYKQPARWPIDSNSKKKEFSLYSYLGVLFFLLIVGLASISEFLEFNNKLLVGFNETGLCMWHSSRNANESSFIFIPWDQVRGVERSWNLGGRFRRGWHKTTVFFQQADLLVIQKSSTYNANDGTCMLEVRGREVYVGNSCNINFEYLSWMPYRIEMAINNQRKKNWA